METTTIQNNSAEIISQAAEKSQEKDIDITQAAIEKIKGEYENFTVIIRQKLFHLM